MKKKSQNKKTQTKQLNIKVVAITSLILNVLLLAGITTSYVISNRGDLDFVLVNSGMSKMCSSEFREKVAQRARETGQTDNERVRWIDYNCQQNGAAKFYSDGFDKYIESLKK